MAAARLGAAMLCLQASIGAVNDLADAELDRMGKPAKPIPAGLISTRAARGWAVAAAGLGLLLAAPSGASTVAVAAIGVALGYLYDLRLSRTALSWLPLALALPLLPIFAWLGTRDEIPAGLAVLVPIAALAGSALMTANGLVDVERDALAGKATIAVEVGRVRAWRGHAAGFAIAVAMIAALGPTDPGRLGSAAGADAPLRLAASAGIPLGAGLIALGVGLLAADRPAIRERGWELEAIGTAVLGLGWLAGAATIVRGATGG